MADYRRMSLMLTILEMLSTPCSIRLSASMPQRTAHEAVARVAQAIVSGKTRVIDVDLAAYFDTVRHDLLLGKVARRVQDPEILQLLRRMLKASGRRGVPQGGVISPLLANIYLTEVDAMLERAKEVTRDGEWTRVAYARYADDLVIRRGRVPATCVVAEGGGPAAPRGAREARSTTERGQELDRGPRSGRGVWIPGLRLSACPVLAGALAAAVHAQAHGADGVAAGAQGGVPALAIAADGEGDRGDQPDPAGLGELLPDRELGPVLWLREELGGEEGAAAFDEGEERPGLRVEEVEYGVVLRGTRALQ